MYIFDTMEKKQIHKGLLEMEALLYHQCHSCRIHQLVFINQRKASV